MALIYCPDCGKPVSDQAFSCPHCGCPINTPLGEQIRAKANKSQAEGCGCANLFIPLGFALMALAPTGGSISKSETRSGLIFFGCIMIAITALIIGIETWATGAGGKDDLDAKGNPREGMGEFVVLTLVMWPLGYPYWMFRRARYGLTNLGIPALIIVGLIIWAVYRTGAFR